MEDYLIFISFLLAARPLCSGLHVPSRDAFGGRCRACLYQSAYEASVMVINYGFRLHELSIVDRDGDLDRPIDSAPPDRSSMLLLEPLFIMYPRAAGGCVSDTSDWIDGSA